ncbi:MAG: hypothetical protein H6Q70_497 [Firmicutes bacterium]|nr:hypothetical protein [Bacillota bacterium]
MRIVGVPTRELHKTFKPFIKLGGFYLWKGRYLFPFIEVCINLVRGDG